MVEFIKYDFKTLTHKQFKPEESFINKYVRKCLESEVTISSTCRIRRILDAKYEKADLKQVVDNQCQQLIPNQ